MSEEDKFIEGEPRAKDLFEDYRDYDDPDEIQGVSAKEEKDNKELRLTLERHRESFELDHARGSVQKRHLSTDIRVLFDVISVRDDVVVAIENVSTEKSLFVGGDAVVGKDIIVDGLSHFKSDVWVDGSQIKISPPSATGSFARGIDYATSAGSSSGRQASFSAFGTNEEIQRMYMAYGSTPWSNGEGLYVLKNGNVGIGTINPDFKLDVSGDIRAESIEVHTSSQGRGDLFTFDTVDRSIVYLSNSDAGRFENDIRIYGALDPSIPSQIRIRVGGQVSAIFRESGMTGAVFN